jgi:glycosyltransferase 2 family protein
VSSPTPSLERASAAPSRPRSIGPKLVASLVIAAGFVWLLRRGGLPIMPARKLLEELPWWAPVSYVLLCCVAMFLRTYRWVYLLRPISAALSAVRVFGIGLVGFTAIFFAPLRMGELARPWLLSRDGEVTFFQAAGTVAAERIIDGLTLTLFLLASLIASRPLSPAPDHVGDLPLPIATVPAAAYGTCALFATALVVMALFYRWRRFARNLVERSVGLVSPRLASWLSLRVERLSDGFKFLPSRNAGAFLRDSVAYWAVMLSATWVLLRGTGIDAGPAEAGVVLGVMGIGTLVPSGPGFFGTYQLAAYMGLAMFFPESGVLGAGAVFSFVSYSIHVLLTAASGVLGAVILSKTKPSTAPA